jgi:hypothetical protein
VLGAGGMLVRCHDELHGRFESGTRRSGREMYIERVLRQSLEEEFGTTIDYCSSHGRDERQRAVHGGSTWQLEQTTEMVVCRFGFGEPRDSYSVIPNRSSQEPRIA